MFTNNPSLQILISFITLKYTDKPSVTELPTKTEWTGKGAKR